MRTRPALFLTLTLVLAGLSGCTASWSGSATLTVDPGPLLELRSGLTPPLLAPLLGTDNPSGPAFPPTPAPTPNESG